MNEFRIRVNEADLLRAGWPRDAVNALRGIIAVIGTGISVDNVGELESLLFTAGNGRAASANASQELQHITDHIAQLRRSTVAQQQLIDARLDALERATRNNNLQQQINELRDYTFGAR